jgi:hypothetical protein
MIDKKDDYSNYFEYYIKVIIPSHTKRFLEDTKDDGRVINLFEELLEIEKEDCGTYTKIYNASARDTRRVQQEKVIDYLKKQIQILNRKKPKKRLAKKLNQEQIKLLTIFFNKYLTNETSQRVINDLFNRTIYNEVEPLLWEEEVQYLSGFLNRLKTEGFINYGYAKVLQDLEVFQNFNGKLINSADLHSSLSAMTNYSDEIEEDVDNLINGLKSNATP